MTELRIKPFGQQYDFIMCPNRFTGAFAGKRGGKTEGGAIRGMLFQESRPFYTPNGIDPYLGIVVAPTTDMLRRLSWAKFMAYSRKLIKKDISSPFTAWWHNSTEEDQSIVYGISGDKPERLEGVKANWIWIDEVFQVKEQLFLEALARVADTQGYVWCTGSLGVQYINPKQHWAYKYFKEGMEVDGL